MPFLIIIIIAIIVIVLLTTNKTVVIKENKPNNITNTQQNSTKCSFDTIESIEAIEIPKYKPINGMGSPVNNIEYILQRKATEHKKNGRMDLAIACLRKSNEIMPHSNLGYPKKEYERLVEFLKEEGEFDEARTEQRKIDIMFERPTDIFKNWEYDGIFNNDLVEVSEMYFVCDLCAKYTARVYSLYGKDKRFPKMPDELRFRNPEEHKYCGLSFFHTFDFSEPSFECQGDIIKYSNRPFKDERTAEQKELFENKVKEKRQEEQDRKDFDYIREFLSNVAPKSFSGYRRMKNTNSANYQKIVEKAAEKGYIIK